MTLYVWESKRFGPNFGAYIFAEAETVDEARMKALGAYLVFIGDDQRDYASLEWGYIHSHELLEDGDDTTIQLKYRTFLRDIEEEPMRGSDVAFLDESLCLLTHG